MTRSPTLLRAADDARVRPAVVAGAFYPARADELVATIDRQLAEVATDPEPGPRPKAVIVPHAGYVYSGPIAAQAFARLRPWCDEITRVVLLGPAHRAPVRSMALSSADRWLTPLGEVALDTDARDRLSRRPDVVVDDGAHANEHALEVEVPFLQRVIGSFTLLPIVVGGARDEDMAAVLDAEWGGPETLVVISTDLSHYLDQATARVRDRRTADRILGERVDEIGPHDACGAYPVRGFLTTARRRGLHIDLVDLRNSGDTAGDARRVVGYGAFVASEPGDEGGGSDPDGGGSDPGGAASSAALDAATADALLATAVDAVRARFDGGVPPRHTATPTAGGRDPLDEPAATFVTLRDGARLLGCIGSLEPRRSLRDDVAANAVSAAFHDPRLPALTPAEFARMHVHISILSPTEQLAVTSRDELGAALVPGVDGVVIEAGRHRATFLPAVWEQLPEVDAFLDQLWEKAGLRAGTWPRGMQAWRYRVTDVEADGPRPPI